MKNQIANNLIYLLKNSNSWKYIKPLLDILQKMGYNYYFVGGVVRDLIISEIKGEKYYASEDVDVVLEDGDIDEVLRKVTNKKIFSNVNIKKFNNFFTASIILNKRGLERIDISKCRKEVYEYSGALPKISPGNIYDDIFRRDFTINSVALRFNYIKMDYELCDLVCGVEDIINKKIRVLHKKSFIDDPTRIMRALRLASTLDFSLERETEKQLIYAVQKKYLNNISQVRLANEIKQILKKGKNLDKLKTYFQKYSISISNNYLDYIFDNVLRYSKELENIDFGNKYICRLIFLSEIIFKRDIKSSISDVKNFLISLNINRDDKEIIYNTLKYFEGKLSKKSLPLCIRKYIKYFNRKVIKPMIGAKDLLVLGLKPGPKFSYILDEVAQLQKKGKIKSKKQALEFVKQALRMC